MGGSISWKLHLVEERMIVIAFILVCALGLTSSQDLELKCVPLYDCPVYYNLIKNEGQSLSPNTKELLRKSHCGFVGKYPMVQCLVEKKNECRTPSGQQGKCVSIKECKTFQQLLASPIGRSLKTVHYLLQKYKCGDSNDSNNYQISVCCSNEKRSFIDQFSSKLPPFSIFTSRPTVTRYPFSTKPPFSNKSSSISTQPPSTTPTKPSVAKRPAYLPRPTEYQCGNQLLNKVIGGKVADIDEFPWTVLLQYQSGPKLSTACAGSLISDRYVVTAAHCVDDSTVRSIGKITSVILGEFDTRNETDCINQLGIEDCADPPVRLPVEEITIYPGWFKRQSAEINHDIALVRLAQKVKFTQFIKPICLPPSSLYLKKNEKLVVTGWGRTENGTASFVKLKTTLPVADRIACMEKYKSDKGLIIGDGELCVGGEAGKDSCSGDSGGPLMLPVNWKDYGTVWFLAGIVSFGSTQPCGMKDYPGLYTYLPKYTNWIYETVRP